MKSKQQKNLVWIYDQDSSAIAAYKECLSEGFALQTFQSLSNLKKAFFSLHETPLSNPILLLVDPLPEGPSILDACLGSELRQPVIVISRPTSENMIQDCFSRGASDFLSKPVDRFELLAKVHRCVSALKSDKSGNQEIIFCAKSLTLRRGTLISEIITAKELQIFQVLNEAFGRSVRRLQICRLVWKNVAVSSKAFDVHLFNLRKKLMQIGIKIRYSRPDSYLMEIED